mmetsp:Transcript_21459/g.47607  ORF Transcript_21459/g.47607 Transcript_21459/m.47607 type:complete len:325 (+) Transcript_21459:48-1022(+)
MHLDANTHLGAHTEVLNGTSGWEIKSTQLDSVPNSRTTLSQRSIQSHKPVRQLLLTSLSERHLLGPLLWPARIAVGLHDRLEALEAFADLGDLSLRVEGHEGPCLDLDHRIIAPDCVAVPLGRFGRILHHLGHVQAELLSHHTHRCFRMEDQVLVADHYRTVIATWNQLIVGLSPLAPDRLEIWQGGTRHVVVAGREGVCACSPEPVITCDAGFELVGSLPDRLQPRHWVSDKRKGHHPLLPERLELVRVDLAKHVHIGMLPDALAMGSGGIVEGGVEVSHLVSKIQLQHCHQEVGTGVLKAHDLHAEALVVEAHLPKQGEVHS